MSGFNYDSYCGIYCGACSVLMAYREGAKDRFAEYMTEDNIKAMRQNLGLPYEENESYELKCRGCKTDTVFINCRDCRLRDCAKGRNVEHCADCEEYPCELIKVMFFNPETLKVLPHLKAVPGNLEAIKKAGVEQWLAEQAEQWKCPDCGTGFSWYADSCSKCGRALEELKDYNK